MKEQSDYLKELEILEYVSKTFKVSKTAMLSKSRKKEIVIAKMFIFFYLRNYLYHSFQQIGNMFDMKHSSIIHSLKTFEDLCQTNKSYREQVNLMCKTFKQKEYYKDTLTKDFYCEVFKYTIVNQPLLFYELKISNENRKKIYKDLKLTPEEIDKINSFNKWLK